MFLDTIASNEGADAEPPHALPPIVDNEFAVV